MEKCMNLERFIALRYLKPRRDNIFVTLIGLISIVGVTVGVTAIVLVLSMLNGFEREVKSRFIGFDAHLKVKKSNGEGMENWQNLADRILKNSDVMAVSPFIVEKAMVTSSNGSHVAFVKGTMEKSISEATDLAKKIGDGKIDFSRQSEGMDGLLAGYSLAIQLDVGERDTITIISPSGVTSPFSIPTAKKFIMTGAFKTDMYEYDNTYVFISIADAQKLFDMENSVSGLDLKLTSIEQSWKVQKELSAELGEDFVVETWYDQHSDLYAAMAMEKWGSLVLLSLIIVVAGFNTVSTLIMVVMQKTPEIGILKAIGADAKMISRVFINQGLIVGGIGIVAGCLIGYSICFLQIHFHVIKLPPDVFFLDAVPMELKWIDFVAIVSVALILCLAATLYPSRKASELLPIDALRA